MSQVHYSLPIALGLQVPITDMVRNVIRDIRTNFNAVINTQRTYQLVINKETGESVDFTFKIKKNPLDEIVGDNPLRNITDMEAYRKRPLITATTFLHGRPMAITLQQEDFDKPLEETLQDPMVDNVAAMFRDHIVGGMAASFYHHGLRDRISLWNHESNFEAIRNQFNGMIDVMWDENGYAIDVLAPDHSNDDKLRVVKRNISFNALLQHQDPNNKNVDVCQRYLDLGIISLIALGLTERGFTWTLN